MRRSIRDTPRAGQGRTVLMKRASATAIAAVVGWYLFALAMLHPLANGPVADSWIYSEAVNWFRRTGQIRFPGYTEAMPVAQVLYGAAWGSIFGSSPASLDIATACLGIVAALLLYGLAMRCGARSWQALAAAGLMICNPCFLFLSFSFMTEVPFVTAMLACHLAFAHAGGERQIRWLWISAMFGVVAFAIRPFAGAALVGSFAAILIYDAILPWHRQATIKEMIAMALPFAVALSACGLIWIWLTVLHPPPWDLAENETHFAFLFSVSLTEYIRSGLLGPLLYLGIVLSPLALVRVEARDADRVLALGAGIFLLTAIAVKAGDRFPSTPEMSCFGGWSNALILRGLPSRFLWQDAWQWVMALLGSVGAAGLIFAAIDVTAKLTRAAAAVMITAAIYWAAMIPLWLFNDRYDLVLVPAGALILALAPMPQKRIVKASALIMTAAMGLMSLGGTYSYQRGLAAVIAARDMLEKQGVRRSSIDAGYELNGLELYRFPRKGEETAREEAGIPMITSGRVDDYTIASRPFQGTRIVGRIPWPGPFAIGERELYILKRVRHQKRAQSSSSKTGG